MLTITFETEEDKLNAINMLIDAGYKQRADVYFREADGLSTCVIIGSKTATVEQHCTLDRQAYEDTIQRNMIPVH